MSTANGMHLDTRQAQAFLADHLDTDAVEIALLGEGAWSRCFAFRWQEQDLVIRFGNHDEDFWKDHLAHAFTTPDLPIPNVLDIGPAFDGSYAISTRVHGVPLETLSATQWRAIVPALVSMLEALRTTDVSSTVGVGSWGSAGNAAHGSWSRHLLAVGDDTPTQRTHGWRNRLAASSEGDAAFRWGFDLLTQVAIDAVPRGLVHCDLINRNVLVRADRISGVLDWGCSLYGDHLYDLAWFEFWAPWFPTLNMQFLRSELERRWREMSYAPEAKEARLLACYLHIGLDHLAYNAYLGDWSAVAATAERMRILGRRG